ncbi:MAG: tRNA (adenosine(37)-N6)-threonylcarbamoyltransferase complex dimerization subunit type 1 TsaB [Firmicutes bacterium]|nr:tRNA (adenosine(37)-N6)-threonylcarbamoyltransferase complex dimerization subunit type 1 TsaB [Bacillota bacterium]
MKILAIDTSGQEAGAAIIDDYIIIGEILLNARTGEKSWTHSEILMPGIDQLFSLTGINMEQIDYVAYTSGPGSFTGLRIGASTALGLAKGLNIPTIPVPTLCSLAYNMLGTGNDGLVIPMMDARRGQVYSAVYRQGEGGTLTRTTDYMALPVDELLAQIQLVRKSDQLKNVIFLGDGAQAYNETIKTALPYAIFAPPNNNRQRASSAAVWALEQIKAGYTQSNTVDILYVRAPQAVQDLKNKAAKNS